MKMIGRLACTASRAADALLDLVYPPGLYCVCCGKIIDDTRTYRMCNECMSGLKWAGERTCLKCGKPLSESNPGKVCFSCREHPHQFRRGYTCCEYGTHERALVFRLKYDGRPDIGDVLGEILYDRMTAEFTSEELRMKYDAVLPVPVHESKFSRRGYNQAALIAQGFAERAGLVCREDILVRVRETHMMRSLSPDERRENIRGAFGIRDGREGDLTGKTILLVDDIYTTGATVDEISSVLRKNGAESVDALSFAAGGDVVKSL